MRPDLYQTSVNREEAFRRGWASFINGRSRDENPYDRQETPILFDRWRDGYETSASQPHAVLL